MYLNEEMTMLGITDDDLVIAKRKPIRVTKWNIYWCDFTSVIPGCKPHPALVISTDNWYTSSSTVKVAMLTSKFIGTSNPDKEVVNNLRAFIDLGINVRDESKPRIGCIKLFQFFDVPADAIKGYITSVDDEILQNYVMDCYMAPVTGKIPEKFANYRKKCEEMSKVIAEDIKSAAITPANRIM